MTTGEKGYEPWAWLAFGLGALIAALYLYLGLRPGGTGPLLAYSYGPFVLGFAAALGLLGGLGWCLLRRPALQRRRTVPLAVLAASLWWCSFPLPYPSSHARSSSRVSFRLPFEEEARVLLGGERRRRNPNPLVLHPSRRFGVCFEPPAGKEADVLSPAAGRVVGLEPEDERAPVRLVIDVAPGEFLVLEGLVPGSVPVGAGAEVVPGEVLGRSGSTLCLFLQDGPVVGRSEGIPFRFADYLADGTHVESGLPEPPQRVQSSVARPER